MSTELVPFAFDEALVRTFRDEEGNVWFVAKDVALALEYAWNGISRIEHVPDEWKGVKPIHTLGGPQEMHCLTEQGLYFFLARSDKPKSLPFQKWIAGEVLPSIRQTGGYGLTAERKAIIDRVPEATKQTVVRSLSEVAMHNPEKARTLNNDIITMLIALAPGAARVLDGTQEPSIISTFWQTWGELVEAGHLANHSASLGLIAVNLPEFVRVARDQGFYSFARSELCRLLPESRKHTLLNRNRTIYSVAARKSVKCWVFRRGD